MIDGDVKNKILAHVTFPGEYQGIFEGILSGSLFGTLKIVAHDGPTTSTGISHNDLRKNKGKQLNEKTLQFLEGVRTTRTSVDMNDQNTTPEEQKLIQELTDPMFKNRIEKINETIETFDDSNAKIILQAKLHDLFLELNELPPSELLLPKSPPKSPPQMRPPPSPLKRITLSPFWRKKPPHQLTTSITQLLKDFESATSPIEQQTIIEKIIDNCQKELESKSKERL